MRISKRKCALYFCYFSSINGANTHEVNQSEIKSAAWASVECQMSRSLLRGNCVLLYRMIYFYSTHILSPTYIASKKAHKNLKEEKKFKTCKNTFEKRFFRNVSKR